LTGVIAALRSLIADQLADAMPSSCGSTYIKLSPIAERARQARGAQGITRSPLARTLAIAQTIEKYERVIIRHSKIEPQQLAVLGLSRDDALTAVRVIDVFVDELDLAEFGYSGVDPEAAGRTA